MRAPLPLLAALAAFAAGACDGLADPTAVSVEPLKIPPPRAEKAKRSVDQALDLYPTQEAAARDPFLTAAEQQALHTGGPVREDISPTAKPVVKKKNLAGLEAIQGDVSFIVFGSNAGRRTAVWRGRTLQEGQEVGDFVVVSIDEDGIRLREKDGPETRYLKFRRESADLWKKN